MKTSTINRLCAGLLAGVCVAMSAYLAHGAVEDRIEKAFPVKEGGKLIMDIDRGSINVKTVSDSTLKIEVVRRVEKANRERGEQILRDHKVEFTQEGADVQVQSEFQGGAFWNQGSNLQVRYFVIAPKKFNVELKSKGGNIVVTDLEGTADARTSGGNLDFGEMQGPIVGKTLGGSIAVASCKEKLAVETSGGNITIGDANSSVSAKTLGGSIKIQKAKGDVVAHTSGGNIDIADVAGKLEASTLGGSVNANLSQPPPGDCVLKTTGGNIQVKLPETAGVDLDAKSKGGSVSTDFPVPNESKPRRTSLKTKLNGGGPAFVARTSGGSVRINKR